MYVVVTGYRNIPDDFTSSLRQCVDVNQHTEFLWQDRQSDEDSFIMLAGWTKPKKRREDHGNREERVEHKERETVQQTWTAWSFEKDKMGLVKASKAWHWQKQTLIFQQETTCRLLPQVLTGMDRVQRSDSHFVYWRWQSQQGEAMDWHVSKGDSLTCRNSQNRNDPVSTFFDVRELKLNM